MEAVMCCRRNGALLALAGALALGCIDIKEALTIRPDGSGTVTIEVRTDTDPQTARMMRQGMLQRSGAPAYPPLGEEDTKVLFPGDAFTVKTSDLEGAKVAKEFEVSFKDVNALLESPYGKVHSLSLERRGGRLEFAAVSGARGLLEAAAAAEGAGAGSRRGRMFAGPMRDLQKNADKLRVEFSVTMPRPVTSSSGEAMGPTATWGMARADHPDHGSACKVLRKTMKAACGDGGVSFTPRTPPRLGLVTFDELKAGKTAATGEPVDEKRIAAAAVFVPYRLKTVRYFDLTGEGHGGWDQGAHLTGVVEIPRDLAPQTWGEPVLEEVTDDTGTSLLLTDERGRFSRSMMDDPFGRGREKPDDKVRHGVTFGFRVPPAAAERIRSLKGSIELKYYTGYEVAKVKDAVPKEAIQDPEKAMRRTRFDPSERKAKSADLDRLGIEMQVMHCMYSGGMTNLSVRTEEKGSTVSEIQVFDEAGEPRQTFSSRQASGGGSSWLQLTVPGQPEGPLSFAILAGGSATAVKVPISLSDVPLRGEVKDE